MLPERWFGKSFLATMAGVAAALSTSLGHAVDSRHNPVPIAGEMDLILLNGKIITVGATQDIRVLAGASTRDVDLGENVLRPA